MIVTSDSYGEKHRLDLDVELAEKTITVRAGSFSIGGSEYVLDDDVEVSFDVDTERRVIRGFLAEEVSTGEVTVLYDEQKSGEPSYSFDGSPYKKLEKIVRVLIPDGDFDFSSEELLVRRYRLLPNPERDERRGRRS